MKQPAKLKTAILWGALLREQRKKKKMTTAELSRKTGINHSNVKKLEEGFWDFRISTLTRLLSALGLYVKVMRKRRKK
jgi:transcriptional regulator with XRE-family HTH domain